MWADPKHMPEHLALWALKHLGPRAAATAATSDRASVIARQTRVTVVEGALVGGPFILLIPVAWCAALLAQAQMVFELAAVAGHSATDELRAADLLVLQGAYASSADARAALTRVSAEHASGRRLPRGTRIGLIWRMAYMLGLLGVSDAKPSLVRTLVGWIFVGIVFVVGLVLPFVWVPYMALWMRKSTQRLGERTIAFYAAGAGADAGVTVLKSVQVGLAGGFVRMLLLLGVPVVIFVVALVSGGWAAFGLLLFVGVAFVVTSAWIGYRWFSRRRAGASRPRAASGPGPC